MTRPRKPTTVKELQGTLQPCRTNPNEPRPVVAEPDEDLNHLSPLAQELWPKFSKILLDMRVLTVADGPALTLLVETFAEGVEARRLLRDLGTNYYEVMDKGGNVTIKLHPAYRVASDCDKRFITLATHFGLTPASRSKVSADLKKDLINEFEDI